jgi:hypothetical protein
VLSKHYEKDPCKYDQYSFTKKCKDAFEELTDAKNTFEKLTAAKSSYFNVAGAASDNDVEMDNASESDDCSDSMKLLEFIHTSVKPSPGDHKNCEAILRSACQLKAASVWLSAAA